MEVSRDYADRCDHSRAAVAASFQAHFFVILVQVKWIPKLPGSQLGDSVQTSSSRVPETKKSAAKPRFHGSVVTAPMPDGTFSKPGSLIVLCNRSDGRHHRYTAVLDLCGTEEFKGGLVALAEA